MRASALTQGDGTPRLSSTRHACRPRLCRPFALHCRAGDFARRGGLRRGDAAVLCKLRTAEFCNAAGPGKSAAARKDIGRARCGTPQSADADITGLRCPHRAACAEAHLRSATAAPAGGARLRSSLQGSLLGGSRLQSLPCKGRWMRRKAQTEGCIAALRRRYPAKPGRALAPCFVGDDACIVPETLRYRKAFAAGVNARPTLRPGTGGDAEAVVRRQTRPRADASIGPYAGGGAGLAGRCQAPPPRRGTSRRRLAAAQGARRPAKRIVSLRNQRSAGG